MCLALYLVLGTAEQNRRGHDLMNITIYWDKKLLNTHSNYNTLLIPFFFA